MCDIIKDPHVSGYVSVLDTGQPQSWCKIFKVLLSGMCDGSNASYYTKWNHLLKEFELSC